MTAALKRIAPNLRAIGIEWIQAGRTGSARLHRLARVVPPTVTTVTSVTLNANPGDGRTTPAMPNRHADPSTAMVNHEPNDGRDGRDGPAQVPGVRERDPLEAAFAIFGDDIADIYVQGTA